MEDRRSAVEEGLAARRYLYELFRMMLGAKPRVEVLEAFVGEVAARSVDLLDGREGELSSAYAELSAAIRSVLSGARGSLDGVSDEYARSFVNPGRRKGYPWESVYASEERTLFQESVLGVRRAYARHDLLPVAYGHEPDDHVATELHFLAKLGERSLEAYQSGDEARLASLVEDQAAFLDEHLLAWAGRFAADARADGFAPFYATALDCLAAFAAADRRFLESLGLGSKVVA